MKRNIIREATNFLCDIFNQDMIACAKLRTAEAEKDYKTIMRAMREVVDCANDMLWCLNEEYFNPNNV